MALVTGSPLGNISTSEDLNISIAPFIYIQDNDADPLWNPDGDTFYFGLSGTSTYPAYEIGCVRDVNLTESLALNDVRCDNIGIKDTVQEREYLEFNFTITSLFPLSTLTRILSGSTATVNAGIEEKFGIGTLDNNQRWMVWAPLVYDTTTGDWLAIHLHKAKFVDPWTWNFPFGEESNITNLKLRAFADTALPAAQQFATVVRHDPSAL